MGFIKGALFGVAVYAAVQHITKKDPLTGRSLLDELMDRAPACIDNVKSYAQQAQQEYFETVEQQFSEERPF